MTLDELYAGAAGQAAALEERGYLGQGTFKLGFGLMRLPKAADGQIDVGRTARMVDAFMAAGGTYFDTAFVYNGSEQAAKAALVDRYPRASYTLASKCFAAGQPSAEAARDQLRVSLERTGAGYFDYYLLHNLGDQRTQVFEDFGLWEWARQMREQGCIRHLGFSFHAGAAELERILEAHPEVEFVQLQINYADWEDPHNQSRANYECCMRHGKPVVIMEPVKGGLLATPPQPVASVLREADPAASCASWALRFAASLPGVVAVLSGMSDEAQMADNLATFRDFAPLDEAGVATVERARAAMAEVDQIPCTNCRYCVKGCPAQVPIPDIFGAENIERVYANHAKAQGEYDWATKRAKASDCAQCGACEAVCPQHLPIVSLLEGAAARFE
jgi:predicted aldo/keto reductase-like oxidoreductase